MSEDIKEQLSALMDGELGRDERAFLMRRLEHDAELRATWTRLHLMRDVITHRPGGAPLNLADRVMQALAEEDRIPQSSAPRATRSWRPWLGAALAASVAMIAVFTVAPGSERAGVSALADAAPAPRGVRPLGVPGPIAPSLVDVSDGVQPVAGERSRLLGGNAPTPISAEQMLLMRHGQMVDGAWWVGGAQPVSAQSDQRLLIPVATTARDQP